MYQIVLHYFHTIGINNHTVKKQFSKAEKTKISIIDNKINQN